MDNDNLYRLMFGEDPPTWEEACKKQFRILRDDRAKWLEDLPALTAGVVDWTPAKLSDAVLTALRVGLASQFVLQSLYNMKTGRLLDDMEADSPEPPSTDP